MRQYQTTSDASTILRVDDGAYIPVIPGNADYELFLVDGGELEECGSALNTTINAQILALEATVTQRRLREAALTEAGRTWLADVDAQIDLLRAQRV